MHTVIQNHNFIIAGVYARDYLSQIGDTLDTNIDSWLTIWLHIILAPDIILGKSMRQNITILCYRNHIMIHSVRYEVYVYGISIIDAVLVHL